MAKGNLITDEGLNMLVCDLDGVIVDFVSAANAVHNRDGYIPTKFDYFEDWGMTANDFWSPIDALGPDFWHHIPLYPWANELISWLGRHDEFVVATACSKNAHSSYGKVKAIQSIFGENFRDYFITPRKWLLAGPERILIDDYEPNCQKFEALGGKAILFPRPWNENRDIFDPLEYTLEELDKQYALL